MDKRWTSWRAKNFGVRDCKKNRINVPDYGIKEEEWGFSLQKQRFPENCLSFQGCVLFCQSHSETQGVKEEEKLGENQLRGELRLRLRTLINYRSNFSLSY